MEQQKLLWTILSVGILILILLGAGMFFFLPSDSTGLAQNGKTTEWTKAASPVPKDTPAQAAPQQASKPEIKKTPVQTSPAPKAAPEPSAAPTPKTAQAPAPKQTTTPAPKATPAPATKQAPAATQQTKPAASTQPAAKPAQTQTQTAKPAQAPAAKPAATTSAAKGSYWVQVGSYATMDAADKTKKELSAKGYTSSIQTIAKDGKTYHRVKIGPYASRSEVDTLLPKIKALPGMGGSFITSK